MLVEKFYEELKNIRSGTSLSLKMTNPITKRPHYIACGRVDDLWHGEIGSSSDLYEEYTVLRERFTTTQDKLQQNLLYYLCKNMAEDCRGCIIEENPMSVLFDQGNELIFEYHTDTKQDIITVVTYSCKTPRAMCFMSDEDLSNDPFLECFIMFFAYLYGANPLLLYPDVVNPDEIP